MTTVTEMGVSGYTHDYATTTRASSPLRLRYRSISRTIDAIDNVCTTAMGIKATYYVVLLMILAGVVDVSAQGGRIFESPHQRLIELNLMSQGLIGKAASGRAPANEFRIEARLYRELLRKLALDNREAPEREKIPKHLLFAMVRLSALLHAAADCKTARVITCPADLMIQLRSQQNTVSEALESMRPISAGGAL